MQKLILHSKTRVTFIEDDTHPSNDTAPAFPPAHLAHDGGFGHHRQITRSRASNTNLNLYSKLLNTTDDPSALTTQLLRAGPDTTKAFINFLTRRQRKFTEIFQCLGDIASEGDAEKAMERLLVQVADAVDAKYGTLYLLDETGEFTVKASNWMTPNSKIPIDRLFSGPTLLKGDLANVYNIKNSDSDSFTEEWTTTYTKTDPDCILSAPITKEDGRVVGVIEMVNKSTPTPYFNGGDEFILKAIASIWRLLLVNSRIQEGVTAQTADIRAFLNTASVMSSEVNLGGGFSFLFPSPLFGIDPCIFFVFVFVFIVSTDLISVIMQTAQELLNAERCSLFMVDRERQELWTTVAQGTHEIRVPMNKGIAGTNKPYQTNMICLP